MKISGFQKLTLLDYPQVMACIIFTPGCNFRCPFCHNWSLVSGCDMDNLIEEQEIFDYLKKRHGIIEGICISGGEPLIQPGLIDFLKKLRKTDIKIKIDTNGLQYDILKKIIEEKLVDYIAMDIKNDLSKYDSIAGVQVNVSKIKKSIELIKKSQVDHEFRTTVIKEYHSIEDLIKISEYVKGSKYYIQNFVLSDMVPNQELHGFKDSELKEIEKKLKEKNPLAMLR